MSGVNKNTCQHTGSVRYDRRLHQMSVPPAIAVERRLAHLIRPACAELMPLYHELGLRERTLTLPVMASVLTSIVWRHLGSVSDAVQELNTEGLMWADKVSVSKQSICERLRTLPSQLFEKLFEHVIDTVHYHAAQRRLSTPGRIHPLMQWADNTFAKVVIADASTLDALVRNLKLLRDGPPRPLAGKMVAVLDAVTRQPCKLWYEPAPEASEQAFWDRIIGELVVDSMLLIDSGFTDYQRFEELTQRSIWFITRAKSNASFEVIEVLSDEDGVRDRIVRLGSPKHRIDTPMRIVEVEHNGKSYRYLSNLLDSTRLPARSMAALYRERWGIEDAFLIVKRLLGLAYFHCCSQNAIELQLWTTWLLYAALNDLRDELGEFVGRRSNDLSLGKMYKALYYFTRAVQRGEAEDPIAYLARYASTFGIIKEKRRRRHPDSTLRRRAFA